MATHFLGLTPYQRTNQAPSAKTITRTQRLLYGLSLKAETLRAVSLDCQANGAWQLYAQLAKYNCQ